ncbi:UDP-N-acetylglucosamine 2-epimerase (non-hydrolysing) [Pseudobutyrivibrio sp. AR14]|uniref:UDP-N-acetylglucosamine 2-epimerase n=1 Tax=Pseudobutyrivibrio sp. AR14 TaxID=1520804 RepID=UPI00088A8C4B|nr:UDP-N-acetylglucosamine 2-epimerase [Pseudobutyrivibrio sp. AR14]SCY45135.1 UDP-N-acetylglucosamine 2-epimerase (non-hydrolysing) [Pseudobutyrivibrio sp. AR14]
MYKVAYATGSRADYGIVTRYLEKLDSDSEIQLDILVTGSHMDDKYGKSIDIIKQDGFNIAFAADIKLSENDNSGVIKSMSLALNKFGAFFAENKYDLIIILGDRFEMMSVAIAAAMNRLPILHIHGGEVTYGNYDEFIRHSITKMSTYHFTSTLKYKNRVIQLGEAPDRVFYLGALGAENCQDIKKNKVREEIKQLPSNKYFLVAFHPETLTGISAGAQAQEILKAIEVYSKKYIIVLMGSNADTGSKIIRDLFIDFCSSNDNAVYIENVDVDSYLYMMKNAIAIIGNSSSGIIEAPSLNTYTINIGDRQKGRERAESVRDVNCVFDEIYEAMKWAIGMSKGNDTIINPYYKAGAAEEYYEKTKMILMQGCNCEKEFFDVDFMF